MQANISFATFMAGKKKLKKIISNNIYASKKFYALNAAIENEH